MRTLIQLFTVLAVGITAGSGLRILALRESEKVAHGAKEDAKSPPVESESSSERSERPTLAEVCEAKGPSAYNTLSHFLEEATWEEIDALMDAVVKGETSIESLMWLIQIRGLELDSERIVAWTRANTDRQLFLDSLYRRWALIDPHAALTASLKEVPWIKVGVIDSMAKHDLDGAISVVEALLPGSSELEKLKRLKWIESAKKDIKATLSDVLALSGRSERRRTLKLVFETWADTDPLKALEWIETEDGIDDKSALIELAIGKLAETQPLLAWSKAETLPNSRNRGMLERTVLSQWAVQDPDAALAWVKSFPQGDRRDHLFSSMAADLAKSPSELLHLARELDINVEQSDRVSRSEVQLSEGARLGTGHARPLKDQLGIATLELAKESPQEAFEALYELGTLGSEGIEGVAKLWVDREPTDAARWAIELPKSPFTDQVQKAVFEAWGRESPEATAAFLAENGFAGNEDLTRTVAVTWAEQDPNASLAWIDQLGGDVRQGVFASAITTVAKVDPMLALQHLDRFDDPATHNLILTTATAEWQERDPAGVMRWLETQPAESEVDELFKKTSSEWVLSRPTEASVWIESMENGPRKDQAVAGMIDALISSRNPTKDFDAAEIWARTITDPTLQQQRLEVIANAADQ